MYIHGNNALKKDDFVRIRVYNDEELEEQEDKKEERRYFMKQKLGGLVSIIIGILQPVLMEGDVTLSLLFIPFGLVLLFTKEKAFTY